METVQTLLTESQREMMKNVFDKRTGIHLGMNIALCFQPLVQHFDFKKGIMKDSEGRYMFDKNRKAILEKDVAKQERRMYKKECQDQYGDQWKTVFFHGNAPKS